MLKRIFDSAVLLTALVLAGAGAYAQSGEYLSYTPYSIFGIGDISQQGSAYNRSMAGVGIASRNVRYLNSINPAAVLGRGYGIVTKQDKLVSSINAVEIDDEIQLSLTDGSLKARVLAKTGKGEG